MIKGKTQEGGRIHLWKESKAYPSLLGSLCFGRPIYAPRGGIEIILNSKPVTCKLCLQAVDLDMEKEGRRKGAKHDQEIPGSLY